MDIKKRHSQFDKSGMLGLVESLGSHLREAHRIGLDFRVQLEKLQPGDVQRIILCGMGGSAIGADMVRAYAANELRVPLYVSRDYEVPSPFARNALVIFSSYSGNTREVLTTYQGLRESGIPKIAVTSGGILRELCEKDNVPCCIIPGGMPPRAAIAYSFMPTLVSLSFMGLLGLDEGEIREALDLTDELCRRYSLEHGGGKALELARNLEERFPFVYACEGLLSAVARRWITQLNENSKTLAHLALFPELCHNEIVGWERPKEMLSKITVIVLQDNGDREMVKRQMDATLELIAPFGAKIIRYVSEGKGRLSRMLAAMILGDFTSVYLALLNEVDPTPVERINILKKRLASENAAGK
jgi:glucose/mannose-6-phosphate isomerase